MVVYVSLGLLCLLQHYEILSRWLFWFDIAEFTWGKVPVKGTLFELCINSDFKFVHIFAAEKNIIPRQNIQTIFVEFCGDEGTIVSMSIIKNSQVNDI